MLPPRAAKAVSDVNGIAAFFDMDKTVLRSSSGRLFLRYARRNGHLRWDKWLRVAALAGLYLAGLVDFPHLMARLMSYVAGGDETALWQISEAFFERLLRHDISDDARARVAWHLRQGHRVALVSAATPYAVRPVALSLGLGDNYLATQLEVVGGTVSGRIIEPACYGVGKVQCARRFAAQHNVDLGQSYFYTDSRHDLPLLEIVGHPVAVNPDARLARLARERRWPVLRFR